MKIFVVLLAICGTSWAVIEPFGKDVCRLFATGVKLRQPRESCGSYMDCKAGATNKKSTCSGGKDYNRNGQACYTLSTSSTSDTFCKDPCKKASPTWVADPKTCDGYYKCVNGSGTLGYCRSDLHFNETLQACVYTSESSCEGYDICDIAPDGVFFKNENNCQEYFSCLKGVTQTHVCEDGYYDALRGCVDRSEVECDVHPTPYQACGTKKKPIWNKFVSDKVSCRGYYYCRDLGEHEADEDPIYGQCPEGTFFSYDIQACFTPHATKCDADRCDGRNRSKVISGTKGCRHYLTCENNEKVAEEDCGPGLYFDDVAGECVDQVRTYAACS